jgi:hypothetical protein
MTVQTSSKRNSTVTSHHSTFPVGAAVAVLAALVCANALANGLVWDDPIVLTRQLLAFRSVGDLIFTPRNIPQFSPDYYRPLTTLTYLIDRALGGSSPFVFHLSVVLYHVAATYLVFRLGLVLFASSTMPLLAAGLAAALFAVHPIHSESVAWGAGRSDVLAACFSLAAVIVYRGAAWSPLRRTTVAAVLAGAATLAKETAIAMFVILPASDWVLGRPVAARHASGRAERRRQREPAPARWSGVRDFAPLGLALLTYLVLRRVALGSIWGPASTVSSATAAQLLAAAGVYAGKLVLPVRQCAYISDLPSSPLALLATGALLAAAALTAVLTWRGGERLTTFLLLWIGFTLVPSLAIVLKIPTAPVAERYLYLPSVGFCLLLGYGVARLLQGGSRAGRAVVIVAVTAILGSGVLATVSRNAVWHDNLSLWRDTAMKNSTDGLPVRGLAAAYLDIGDTAQAAEYFHLALQRRNDQLGRFTIYNNLGTLAMREKKLDEAEQYYATALSINPAAPDCLFNLGLIALTRAMETTDTAHAASWKHDQAQRARELFERALQLSPLDPDIHIALGQTLAFLGEPDGARARYERALELGLPAATGSSVRKLLAELP